MGRSKENNNVRKKVLEKKKTSGLFDKSQKYYGFTNNNVYMVAKRKGGHKMET